MRAAGGGASRASREVAQVAGVDLAALAHPGRRLALVGHAHLEGRVGQQAPDHGCADRAGAARDEYAVHFAAVSAATSGA